MSDNTTTETTTPEGKLVIRKLMDVMADVQVVKKDGHNNHSNYNFRGIDAVMNAVGPALRKHRLIVTPNVQSAEYERQLTQGQKPSTSVRVIVDYIFIAEDGSTLVVTAPGEATDTGDKATAKAMSVAFRTALLQALCLPTDDPDPDAETYQQEMPAPMAQSQIVRIKEGLKLLELEGDENEPARTALLQEAVGRETRGADLTYAEADLYIAALTERVDAKKAEANVAASLGATPLEGGEAPASENPWGQTPDDPSQQGQN